MDAHQSRVYRAVQSTRVTQKKLELQKYLSRRYIVVGNSKKYK